MRERISDHPRDVRESKVASGTKQVGRTDDLIGFEVDSKLMEMRLLLSKVGN